MSARLRWLVPMVLSMLVLTCGQKGPLRLPDEEPSAGEREGRSPSMNEPSAGEREGRSAAVADAVRP